MFSEICGWSRSELVNQVLSVPRDALPSLVESTSTQALQFGAWAEKSLARRSPSHQLLRWRRQSRERLRLQVGGADGRLATNEWPPSGAPFVSYPNSGQYPSSLAKLKDLFDGHSRSVRVPWRVVLADGFLYEVRAPARVAPALSPHHTSPLTALCFCPPTLPCVSQVLSTKWTTGCEEVVDESGRRMQRPVTEIASFGWDDVFRIDTLDE